MAERYKTVILGAGPAGLAAALGHGPEAVVIEQSNRVGGLASSLEFDGVLFDIGGHSFHTPHPAIEKLVCDSVEMFHQVREARCFTHGQMINYPFQTFFHELNNRQIVEECAYTESDEALGEDSSSADFSLYLKNKFGIGIANHFLLPYNEKLWGKNNLERMSTNWIEERVVHTKNQTDPSSAPHGKRKALQHDAIVSYPAKGGFGKIFDLLAGNISNIQLEQKVAAIDPYQRSLRTDKGKTIYWQNLISTLPITQLVSMVARFPQDLISQSKQLQYVSLKLILVTLKCPLQTKIQRIYCADDTSPAHKIVLNNNSSDFLRSRPKHGIMGEISSNRELDSDSVLIDNFIESLFKMQIINSIEEVSATTVIDTKYGYPVPTLSKNAIIASLKDELSKHRITVLGRFGEWDYINSDEALHRGFELGHLISHRLE